MTSAQIGQVLARFQVETRLATEGAGGNFLDVVIGQERGEPYRLRLGSACANYHGILAGRTGTGKTRLLTSILLQCCETYSPRALQLHLIDLKEGVSFHIFRGAAHVCAVHGETEPALDHLSALQQELIERARLFQEIGGLVDNIDKYNTRAVLSGRPPLPRRLVVIDESQVLYTSGYAARQRADVAVDAIARKGRAYGLHLFLVSQSFQGVDMSAAARAQMSVRMSLSLTTSSECTSVMGRANDGPMALERWSLLVNTHAGDPDQNRVVRLPSLSDEAIETRVARLLRGTPVALLAEGAVGSTRRDGVGESWG